MKGVVNNIRMEHWLVFYKQFLHNSFTIVFGSGSTFMYYESTIFSASW